MFRVRFDDVVKEVSFNTNELDIQSTELITSDGVVHAGTNEWSKETQTTTAKFATLKAAKGDIAQLKVQYTGKIGNTMNGFYKSSYTDVKGVKK